MCTRITRLYACHGKGDIDLPCAYSGSLSSIKAVQTSQIAPSKVCPSTMSGACWVILVDEPVVARKPNELSCHVLDRGRDESSPPL